MSEINPQAPIVRAFQLFSSQADMARACDVSQPIVHKWLRTGKVSAGAAVRIERATRARDPQRVVHRWELNEIFMDDLDETA